MKQIAIYGAGGLGREVLALIHSLPEWNAIGFYDDNVSKGTVIHELPVLGNRNDLVANNAEPINLVVAVGNPIVKKDIIEFLRKCSHIKYPVLIHPKASVLEVARVKIGEGTILTAGCVLTTDIKIGNHVLVNLNATIGHDSILGNFTSIMPGVNLGGEVIIGECVLIGSGANVLPQCKVGEGCIIGSGAVVTKDIEKFKTAIGIPARIIK